MEEDHCRFSGGNKSDTITVAVQVVTDADYRGGLYCTREVLCFVI